MLPNKAKPKETENEEQQTDTIDTRGDKSFSMTDRKTDPWLLPFLQHLPCFC